jgi:hypothetical protein
MFFLSLSRIVMNIPKPILIVLGYLAINLIFNYRLFWSELIFDRSRIGAVWGEVQMFEWLTEKFYRQFITGHNPFGLTTGILYPFTIHLGLTDAANGLWFVFLRPFLSVHQSLSVIIAGGQLFANIGMYLLLRKLKTERSVAFLFGFAYGFMTFLTPRQGHLNYWCLYLFPWFYYCLLAQLQAKHKRNAMVASIGIAIFFVLTLWLNFYYFIMLLISIFTLIVYLMIREKRLLLQYLKKMAAWWSLTTVVIGILLLPWLTALYRVVRFDNLPKTQGWAGAIEFSADLFGWLIPSSYGYYLYPIANYLASRLKFAQGIFENFTYPGLIVIFSFSMLVYLRIKKRLPANLVRRITPIVIVSLLFWLLTMGPFLHVFGKWGKGVGDNIRIVFPLPYLILHYIPFLNNIRVPGRLVVGLIFFSDVVGAMVINYWIARKKPSVKWILIGLLITLVWLDQRYIDTLWPPIHIFPYRIYEFIKKDRQPATVMEIPFTVRDGFTYFGDSETIDMSVGEMLHGKPVIGGYTGRISEYKNIYYRINPLFGYLGRKIDPEVEHNVMVDQTQLPYWQKMNVKAAANVVDFLDIKYVITQDDKPYLETIQADLKSLQYRPVMKDVGFTLWEKPINQRDFLTIEIGRPNDETYLGMGWQPPSDNGRWSAQKSSVMLKLIKPKKMTLHFKAKGKSDQQEVTVFVNQHRIKSLIINHQLNDYSIPLDNHLISGVNEIHFIFTSPSSAWFTSISLSEEIK